MAEKSRIEREGLHRSLDGYRVVIVGEHHGLAEPSEIVKAIVRGTGSGRRFTHLTVEMSEGLQPAVDRYFAGETSVLANMKAHFGKLGVSAFTEEFWSVFSFVREYNRDHPDNPINVRLIDVNPPNTMPPWRERHMFEHVNQIVAADLSNRVLVWVGTSHAAKSGKVLADRKEWNGEPVAPLGVLLQEEHPRDIASIYILSRDEPLWQAIESARLFEHSTAIRFTDEWPSCDELLAKPTQMQRITTATSIVEAYDYAIWWPSPSNGTRVIVAEQSHAPEPAAGPVSNGESSPPAR